MSRKKKIISLVKTMIGMMSKKRVMTYAGAAVYHMVIALPPALMLLMSLIRFLPITQEEVTQVLSDTLGERLATLIDSLVSTIFNSTGTITAISAVLLLVAASGAIRSLMRGLDEVYGGKHKGSVIAFWVWAIVYTLALLLMIALSLALLVYGKELLEYLGSLTKEGTFAEGLIDFLKKTRYLFWSVIQTVMFMVFYRCLPAVKPKFRKQFPGALFCAFAWAVFSWGFSIYVSVSDKFGAYGYLGTIMIVMMWMYYCLTFFLLGGCINVYLASRAGSNSACQEGKHLG